MVNGSQEEIEIDAERMLLHVLRDKLGLTGSKIGCAEGQCGVCTVLVDQQPVRSCITPVREVADQPIVTIEGLARNGQLHPLQQAFLDQDALQCGYCTPGMIMAAVGLLRQHPAPTTEQIVEYMQGNLCRCGTYPRIVRAIQQAAAELAHSGGQA
ncbi:MAG: (2Fe-2S)-binding protein [Chloroflexi bacterium]|nr:(2Fe-2S)-binding protein [Chloroflexota bacterium]